ncbi:MAG TPA: amidohydrolase family protein [Gemmataceae bacterium]|nr:amidohydrolase family protein [Gemmataceae bacterium]
MSATTIPEHNVTGQDYQDRQHFRYTGPPLVDIHAHVMRPRNPEKPDVVIEDSLEQARTMFAVADEFNIGRTYSMCPPEDIPLLRDAFGDRLGFNGPINKKRDEPEDAAYRLLDRFLEQGVEIIKFWSAPRGRDRGLFVDAPWRIEAARRAQAAGLRLIMVHVSDPDLWFEKVYTDATRYGTKAEQYPPFCRMMEMFPDLTWIAAHMGGDPEHADHLQALLERYPNLYFDTSATKWQVREVSAHRDAIRSLICRHPTRFLFGSDLVTRPGLLREHYVSRYWCQRTLWESAWEGPSPIQDPDFSPTPDGPSTPMLRGVDLPPNVLAQVYRTNALRLLKLP